MAERLRRAAAWLGLVADDRYRDDELTEGVDLDELSEPIEYTERTDRADRDADDRHRGEEASVTALEPRRRTAVAERPQGHTAADHAHSETPEAPVTRTADLSRIITVHPRTYNEARAIGEHFRDGVPVIMNLSEMEGPDAKRLVDFAAGLIFGLRGSMERVTSRVFLLSPPGVSVTAEDKQRIAGEFFNQS
ncbi:MAG TPA: cell division protein SepF [Candidatus Avipropionibacterium avicola]|uniref:Cell division protein SepF n=1 Tax=Candidatus Avipropionibacterium avicola TaxID=2840701 RepID=A0A9D1GWN2_9ACTN|nr:cell division protein SepF [Candidatus Avipropionibacterium avicola]